MLRRLLLAAPNPAALPNWWVRNARRHATEAIMSTVTEVGPDILRICTYVPQFDLQFSQFLIRDDEPLLFHTGLRKHFPQTREALAKVVDPARIRWICFSHFEADECGALNEWLTIAPHAQAACSFVGVVVNLDDFAIRPARALAHDEVITTGKYRFRFQRTPHVPHGWEAGLLFEEVERTLFCSDLFDHGGDVEPLTESDILARHRDSLEALQSGPLAHYLPYTPMTEGIVNSLADLQPRTLATMHGSVFRGDGGLALRGLAGVLREIFGRQH
jgi:flavorubredoxin